MLSSPSVTTSDPSGRENAPTTVAYAKKEPCSLDDPFTLLPFAAGRATGTEVTEVLERV